MNFRDIVDIDLVDEIELSEIEDNEVERVAKRYIRDGQNPLEFYNDGQFRKRYRFSKNSLMFGIIPLIENGLSKSNNRGLPIAPVLQLLICLRFYATASFQLVMGDIQSVSQPTVSRIVFRVTSLISSLFDQYIKMPLSAESSENRRLFCRLGFGNGVVGIPGVDGAIDCTHIRLVHTRFSNFDEVFRNRKGYFSLNVQTVVGPRTEFLDIVPEWPGSTHDSRIFQNSRIFMRYQERRLDGILIGDSGYPCLPFLMTPLRNTASHEEASYNEIHIRTRLVVERTYGIWKRRFPCLSRGLTNKLYCSTGIIVACAVLHNLSLIYNDELPEDEFEPLEEEEMPPTEPHWQPLDGPTVRDRLINRMFN